MNMQGEIFDFGGMAGSGSMSVSEDMDKDVVGEGLTLGFENRLNVW